MAAPRRLRPVLLLALACATSAHAAPASPYSRANSARTPVYVPCEWPCADSSAVVANRQYEFRMAVPSRDGRYTAFVAYAEPAGVDHSPPPLQVYVYDRKAGTVELASRGLDGKPTGVAATAGFGITADGRYTWFTSGASNLVAGDRNKSADFFTYDRTSKRVTRLSVDVRGKEVSGASAGVMSADGTTVAFVSSGDVLRKGTRQSLLFFKNLRTGKAGVVADDHGVPDAAFATSSGYLMTANGRYLVDTDDVAHATAIGLTTTFGVYDLWTGRYLAVPGSDRGISGHASVDAAGRSMVFDSRDGITRVDLATGMTQTATDLVPTLARPSFPTLSDDGRTMTIVAAGEAGADPAQSTGGVYVIPLDAAGKPGTARLVTPLPATGSCLAVDCARHQFAAPVVSGNGHAVAFLTDQALVPEDPATVWDVYLASV